MRESFANGYGVSVIDDGYGGSEGYKELAVLHDDELCYRSGITSDVLGWLADWEVAEYTAEVAALPRNDDCKHDMNWTYEEE